MRKNIEKLFSSNHSGYKIAKETGIPQQTISRFISKSTDMSNMKLVVAEILNEYYLKNKGGMTVFNVGTWWNDSMIDLVEIDEEVYALNGWNGESFVDSWKCEGEENMDASEEVYVITPVTKEADGEFETVGYELSI